MISSRDITVVVQGPITPHNTDFCLKSIKKYLPEAKIILSTWKGSDVRGLDYDEFVESDDPGYFKLRDDIFPGVIRNESANRQIVSTLAGLRKSKTKFSIKIRSDLYFKNINFLDYYEMFNKLPFDNDYKLTKERVLMLTTINPKRRFKNPFSMSDWFYFGLTEDLINIFDIPLMSEENIKGDKVDGMYSIANNYSTEQWLWLSLIFKYRKIPFFHYLDVSGNNIELSERYLANNSIIISARRAGVNSLKYPGGSYAQIPCLSYSGLYTFNEYKGLLNKYANNKIFILPKPIESMTYFVVYNMRFWVKKISPKFHDFIAKTINPKNHKK